MPRLVTVTGPIAAGKSTVAAALAERCTRAGLTVVVAEVDDVAAMVAGPGAAGSGLWFAAHEAHGALVARWLRTGVDVVVGVGPIYTPAEERALLEPLPPGTEVLRVLLDAPLPTTWDRARSDPARGLSREHAFHVAAHERFRRLLPDIPADLRFDAATTGPQEIAVAVAQALGREGVPTFTRRDG